MRKIALALTLVLATAGAAYAGCFTTANFSPSAVDAANAQKLALQCYAMRSGGSWSIAGSGSSATQSGGSTYSAMTPWNSGGVNRLDLIQNGSGSHVVQVSWTNQYELSFYLPSAPTEQGKCQVYFTLGGNVFLDNPGTPGVVTRVKYCR